MGSFFRELFWGLVTPFFFLVGCGSLIVIALNWVPDLDRTVFQELSLSLYGLIGVVSLATCAILAKLDGLREQEDEY